MKYTGPIKTAELSSEDYIKLVRNWILSATEEELISWISDASKETTRVNRAVFIEQTKRKGKL